MWHTLTHCSCIVVGTSMWHTLTHCSCIVVDTSMWHTLTHCSCIVVGTLGSPGVGHSQVQCRI